MHYRHAKAQNEYVSDVLLNFLNCITPVECFRTDPPGMFFNQFAQRRAQRLAVIRNENLSQDAHNAINANPRQLR